MKTTLILAFALVATLALRGTTALAQAYDAQQLPHMLGSTQVKAVSSRGYLAGTSTNDGKNCMFMCSPSLRCTQSCSSRGQLTPTAVNNHGEVVGYLSKKTDTHENVRAFAWSKSLGFAWLPKLLSAHTQSAALDINDAGTIVGFSGTGSSYQYLSGDAGQDIFRPIATAWSRNKKRFFARELGLSHSAAYRINAHGAILVARILTDVPPNCINEEDPDYPCYPEDFTTTSHTLVEKDSSQTLMWSVTGSYAALDPLRTGSAVILLDDNWVIHAEGESERPVTLTNGTERRSLKGADEPLFSPQRRGSSHRNAELVSAIPWDTNQTHNQSHAYIKLWRTLGRHLRQEATPGCLPTGSALSARGIRPWELSSVLFSSSSRIVLNYANSPSGPRTLLLRARRTPGPMGVNLCTKIKVTPVGECAEDTYVSDSDEGGDVYISVAEDARCSLSVQVYRLRDNLPISGARVLYVREDPAIHERVTLDAGQTGTGPKGTRISFSVPQFDRRIFKLIGAPDHPTLLESQSVISF